MLSGACGPIFQSYLNYIRSLNIDVIGIDIRENQFTKKKLGSSFFLSPNVREDSNLYINFLMNNLKEFDLFFPYSDEELVALSRLPLNSTLRKKIVISWEFLDLKL